MLAVTVLIASYLLGAIPFAVIVTRWRTGIDVRRVGSGNPGATNVWRSAGPALGASVLLLDCAKGAAAVTIAWAVGLDGDVQAMAGLAAILGHVWPVWLHFHGGKGVATATGAFAAMAPWTLIIAMVVFAIAVATTRLVSLGSILAAIALAVAAVWLHEPVSVIAAASVAAVVIVMRHHENIQRLRRGTEPRVTIKEMR